MAATVGTASGQCRKAGKAQCPCRVGVHLGNADQMTRTVVAMSIISAVLLRAAHADTIRRTEFPAALLGTWAKTAAQCASNDKSNIVIEAAKYGDANGSCALRWLVETPGSHGTNYAVHAQCSSASQPVKTQIVNIIIRPQSQDAAVMGRSFDELKSYQRCPAR
jgi:hypothetical protein